MIGFIIGSIFGGTFATLMITIMISAGQTDKKLAKASNITH